MNRRIFSRRGFSIVEVLVAIAILAVIAMTMTVFSNQMSSNLQRANLDAEADQVIASVQNLLNQTGDVQAPLATQSFAPCDGAMQMAGGTIPVWDVIGGAARGPVDLIRYRGQTLAQKGALVTQNLKVKDMYLREPDPTLQYAGSTMGEGRPARSTTTRNGKDFDTVVAKLVIEFDIPNAGQAASSGGQAAGRSMPSRTADVVVAIGRGAKKIVSFCFNNQPIMASNIDCSTVVPLPVCETPPVGRPNCSGLFFVKGFDSSGNPVCACKMTCATDATLTGYTWQASSGPSPGVPCFSPAAVRIAGDNCRTLNDSCTDTTLACGPAGGLGFGQCHLYVCKP